jgi:ribonuclease Z
MNVHAITTGLLAGAILGTALSTAPAAPCLIVTLTGTHGGPQQSFNGLASAGTLVRCGDDADDCGAVKLQFDAGRGTTMRLSQLGVEPDGLLHAHAQRSYGRLC